MFIKKKTLLLLTSCLVIAAVAIRCDGGGSSSGNDPSGDSTHADKPDSTTAKLAVTSNVKPTCTVSPEDFKGWFTNGSVTKDGPVTWANSLDELNTNCDFYQWSWQMFLWQTSPNGEGLVFNTPPFFDLDGGSNLVSDPNNDGGSSFHRVRGAKSVDAVGQAGGKSGVLMSQNVGITPDGSLVYYAIHVNDVYAYMVSGVNSQAIELSTFPTTEEQLKTIKDYAQSTYNYTIDDGSSLAMELKSSWVKADASMDLSKYITIVADIPKFTPVAGKEDQEWTWDGTTMEDDVTLALMGYHVTGSTKDHPEMIWATFEHVSNTPDLDYYYTDTDNNVQKASNWNADGTAKGTDWMFIAANGQQQATNQMHMELKKNNINAVNGKTISASNTSRENPWGNTPTEDNAVNNTDIISLNENIAAQLAEGDPRANYFLVGATWTKNGIKGLTKDPIFTPEVEGSLKLANSTMETYFQYNNCFDCHKGGAINGLSHIFGGIKPLPKPSN